MNLTRNCTFIHFQKFEKTKIPFLTHPQPTTAADRRALGQRHSAPAMTYVFSSTSRTRLGYRLNELELHTSAPDAMAAQRHRARRRSGDGVAVAT